MLSTDELTPPERQLWDAFPEGRTVDLTVREPLWRPDPYEEEDEPEPWTPEGRWEARHTVRARVIAALLLGANPAAAGAVAALRLHGARIVGELDLSGAETPHLISFSRCSFAAPVTLHGAGTSSIRLLRCEVPGIEAHLLRIEGTLNLTGSVIDGRVGLNNARISGQLHLSEARIGGDGTWALTGGGLEMGGGVFGRRGFVADAGVRLAGARLAGGVFLEGARLAAASGERLALSADNASVTVMLLSDGFAAAGFMDLAGMQVSDRLSFAGADLAEVDEVRCRRLQGGDLDFTPAVAPAKSVDLRGAKVATLHHGPHTWPDEVRLGDLQYEGLHYTDPEGVGMPERIAWLRRSRGYSPQPYEQLAAWYRRIGHDHNARGVLLAKQRDRRRTLRPLARLWGYLLDGTVGYGYRPWLAGLWLAVVAALGTAVFAQADRIPIKPDDNPGFHPLVYTLDLLVPIGGFGMRDEWRWVNGGAQGLAYALVAIGWILTTAVVAGVSRTLNRT
ncbi:oxidoreductase [Streptomyces boninensis]|uniref:oxidoreductase n=1 Tax=Streptomyces boninensis TaxID=2039455 RepID=UPI003B21443B